MAFKWYALQDWHHVDEANQCYQVATECLHTLFSRPLLSDSDFEQIVMPMYHANTVVLLGSIYNWRPVDADDIDEERYVFLKKFAEVNFSKS